MRQVAADRPAIGLHRNCRQAEAREGAQIGGEHLVVGQARALGVEIERIGVLHQELARAHDAEARPHLVAELPLDVVEVERQILVRTHAGAEDLGDHLLVGRTVEHVALVAVADAQHLLAVVVVAAGFAPQLGRLQRRHQQLDRAGAILLLAHDGADLVQHAQAQRQPGVDAGALLADHAGAQHQPVRGDLGLLRRFLQHRQEIAGEAHVFLGFREISRASSETRLGTETRRSPRERPYGPIAAPRASRGGRTRIGLFTIS